MEFGQWLCVHVPRRALHRRFVFSILNIPQMTNAVLLSCLNIGGGENRGNQEHLCKNVGKFSICDHGTISQVLLDEGYPQYIGVPNNPVPDIKTQEDTLWRNFIWLQNTFFFFKKYQVDLILSAHHSPHTSNIKINIPIEKLNPP